MTKNRPTNDPNRSGKQRSSSHAARQTLDAALRNSSLKVNDAAARYLAEELPAWKRAADKSAPVSDELSKPDNGTRLATAADLGNRIRAARKHLGATQQELAELSGLSLGSIKALEAGGNVGMQHVFTVLAVVGIELHAD